MLRTPLFLFLSALFLFPAGCRENPYRDGEWLYGKNCASCHGAAGQGLGELIPPLAGADYLQAHPGQLPCIVRHGLQTRIEVNGKTYEQPMAGVAHLSDIEITNLLNYVNNSWGNTGRIYKLEEVRTLLDACAPAR